MGYLKNPCRISHRSSIETIWFKKLSARGRLGESGAPTFLFWDPPHISETNRARKLKFGTLVGICRYYGYP